jgi:hypothetical protein
MHPAHELSEIAQEFRHRQAEHEREGPEGSWRRREGARLAELERHFETLLARWIDDPAERELWRAHLYRGESQPELRAADMLLYKGCSAEGSLMEIREQEPGEHIVVIDGTRVDHFEPDLPIASPTSFGGSLYDETFDSPPEAIGALNAFLSGATREPPWPWATTLHSDGIIDTTFALTARGRRLLGRGD